MRRFDSAVFQILGDALSEFDQFDKFMAGAFDLAACFHTLDIAASMDVIANITAGDIAARMNAVADIAASDIAAGLDSVAHFSALNIEPSGDAVAHIAANDIVSGVKVVANVAFHFDGECAVQAGEIAEDFDFKFAVLQREFGCLSVDFDFNFAAFVGFAADFYRRFLFLVFHVCLLLWGCAEHVLFQRIPALKAVVHRQRELRFMQACGGIRHFGVRRVLEASQSAKRFAGLEIALLLRFQQFFGLFLELAEIRP
ncbi:hypothetical protein JXA32_01870 [Candidatus Sumerlaeota bacterium]|nr:hypothetical protein [Candidatus Sumerlaeota bacterium]